MAGDNKNSDMKTIGWILVIIGICILLAILSYESTLCDGFGICGSSLTYFNNPFALIFTQIVMVIVLVIGVAMLFQLHGINIAGTKPVQIQQVQVQPQQQIQQVDQPPQEAAPPKKDNLDKLEQVASIAAAVAPYAAMAV